MASSSNSEPLADHEEAAKKSEEKQFPSQTRYIAFLVVAIIVVMSVIMGIIWAVVQPKHPKVVVQKGYIKGTRNYSPDGTRLSCVLHFEIKFHNPNKKATIYFDTLHSTTSYSDKTKRAITSLNDSFILLPDFSIPCFYDFPVEIFSMYGYMPKYLRQGTFILDISFQAKIRFGFAKWKSQPRTINVYCSSLVVFSGQSFKPTVCKVDY